jgi:hypothetical protein
MRLECGFRLKYLSSSVGGASVAANAFYAVNSKTMRQMQIMYPDYCQEVVYLAYEIIFSAKDVSVTAFRTLCK